MLHSCTPWEHYEGYNNVLLASNELKISISIIFFSSNNIFTFASESSKKWLFSLNVLKVATQKPVEVCKEMLDIFTLDLTIWVFVLSFAGVEGAIHVTHFSHFLSFCDKKSDIEIVSKFIVE